MESDFFNSVHFVFTFLYFSCEHSGKTFVQKYMYFGTHV